MSALSSSTCNKLLVLFGGGYNSSASVFSYYNIMCGLLDKTDFIKEKEIQDKNEKVVKELVSKLKNLLGSYWNL